LNHHFNGGVLNHGRVDFMTETAGGRCCVFQPFDKGPHDKRYKDIIAPAIRVAGLDPYRVDRDDGAVILIDTLHDEIRSAAVCLADISTRNPNVMYELGYAIASGKEVVIICASTQADKFPFDIQHRGIITYALDSTSDFEQLKAGITLKIKALLKKQAATQQIASVSPIKSTHGLQPSEVAALAMVMANIDSSADSVSTYIIKQDMEKAGFTRLATQLALTRLSRMNFVAADEESDMNGNRFYVYRLLDGGEVWLLENQDKLELRVAPPDSVINDDDIPF
jgi:nucleoside 2-deoxyribosyltransferase